MIRRNPEKFCKIGKFHKKKFFSIFGKKLAIIKNHRNVGNWYELIIPKKLYIIFVKLIKGETEGEKLPK